MTKLILVFLLLSFYSFAQEDDLSCAKLRTEITNLDQKINEHKVHCQESEKRTKDFCDDNMGELKERFRKKMNKFIILDGIKGIKDAIEADTKAIVDLDKIELKNLEDKFDQFKFSMHRGAMAQESFYNNSNNEFFFLEYQDHLNKNNITSFDKDKVEDFINKKCQNKQFPICEQYQKSKAAFGADANKWKAIMESMHGLGIATSKYNGKEPESLKSEFSEFISYLDIPVMVNGQEKKQNIRDVIKSDEIQNLQSAISTFNNSTNKTENQAAKLNETAQAIKDKLQPLAEEMTELKHPDYIALYGDSNKMNGAYKELDAQLNDIIFKTKKYSSKSKENAIKCIEDQLTNAKEIAALNISKESKPILAEIKSVFGLTCVNTDLTACRKTIEEYKARNCNNDQNCEMRKSAATKHLDKLDKLMMKDDINSLEKALACYNSDATDDPSKLITCLGDSNLNINNLDTEVSKLKKELDDIQSEINEIDARGEVEKLNLFKAFAINQLRSNKNCNAEENFFKINTSCRPQEILEKANLNALIDEAGDIISFYNQAQYSPALEGSIETLKQLCAREDVRREYPQTCESYKNFNKKVVIQTGPKFENPFDDYEPDYEEWKKVLQKRNQTPGAMMGFVGGLANDFLPGYQSYAQSSQMNQARIDWAFQSKQEWLNWNANKEQYFEDFYKWQMNNYYYPNFAGGRWDYATDPFNPNFNYNNSTYAYPQVISVQNNGQFNFTTPSANFTSGDMYTGSEQ